MTREEALRVWEETYGELPDNKREKFLARDELGYLEIIDEDIAGDAIQSNQKMVEFVMTAQHEQIKRLREGGDRARIDPPRSDAPASNEIAHPSTKETGATTARTAAGESETRRPTVDLRRTWAAPRPATKPGRQIPTGHPEPTKGKPEPERPTTSTPATPPPPSGKRAGSDSPKPQPTRGNRRSSSSQRAGDGTIAGVSHAASGFSGKPRHMPSEFDDREPCSSCGAMISASSAALHECW